MKLGSITLKPEQEATMLKLQSGNILVAGVGSGKTYMGIFWAARQRANKIIVITTAAKRDKIAPGHKKPDWQESLDNCGIRDYIVDSWNNIKKYDHCSQSVFLFDEAKQTGYGAWGKSFIKIAKNNKWIVMSATPADNFIHYMPTFVAHGFYRNKTDFYDQHVEFDKYAKYPKIKTIHGTARLEKLRKSITVVMEMPRHTKRHYRELVCDFDYELLKAIQTTHWNGYTEAPIETPSEMTQLLRRVVAIDPDRMKQARQVMKAVPRLIIFYNYNYELEILEHICEDIDKEYTSWNGKHHDLIPTSKQWIYLVQYNASEGWECITTDSMMFYSPNYSWRAFEQCCGRIDRMNTKYTDLYYYSLISKSKIDKDVIKANKEKRNFNENGWGKQLMLRNKNER